MPISLGAQQFLWLMTWLGIISNDKNSVKIDFGKSDIVPIIIDHINNGKRKM